MPLLGKWWNLSPAFLILWIPGGFRLTSNFGYDAMQSQEHGHLHILGGTFLGHYVG